MMLAPKEVVAFIAVALKMFQRETFHRMPLGVSMGLYLYVLMTPDTLWMIKAEKLWMKYGGEMGCLCGIEDHIGFMVSVT
jgi:hypothetical protein